VAAELPGDLGASLLHSARKAFTSGLQMMAVIGPVLLAVLAVLVATLLPELRTTPDAGDEPDPAAALEPAP
jgi:MFS transporter, DHA2 family, multidrug resistance protein